MTPLSKFLGYFDISPFRGDKLTKAESWWIDFLPSLKGKVARRSRDGRVYSTNPYKKLLHPSYSGGGGVLCIYIADAKSFIEDYHHYTEIFVDFLINFFFYCIISYYSFSYIVSGFFFAHHIGVSTIVHF